MGPCQDLFGGVYNSIDIFYKMSECLGLSQKPKSDAPGYSKQKHSKEPDNRGKEHGEQFGYTMYGEQNPRYGGKDGWNKGAVKRDFRERQSYH